MSEASFTEPDVTERAVVAEKSRAPSGKRGRGIAWAGAVLLVALVAIAAEHSWRGDAPQAAPVAPPPRVTVAKPLLETVADTTVLLGQFSAVDSVELRAQVSGYLTEIHFKDGQIVHKGDLLFVIDPRPYEIQLEQANAQFQTASARLVLANKELNRSARLNRVGGESDELVDERTQAQSAAAAAVKSAEAAIHAAQLNLEFTHIVAPFNGRVSRRRVSIGSLVTGGPGAPSSTELTTIVSLDPIYLDFDMSEADYRAYQRGHGVAAPHDDVAISLGGDDRFDRHGTLDFLDNAVNRSSGTIHARATVPDPDLAITPGQFARLRVPLGRPALALLVPAAAVVPDQANEMVMTVADDGTIVPKQVEIGGLYHGLRVIRSGLAPTDTVVIDGLVRVRPGAKVTPAAGTIAAIGGNDAS